MSGGGRIAITAERQRKEAPKIIRNRASSESFEFFLEAEMYNDGALSAS